MSFHRMHSSTTIMTTGNSGSSFKTFNQKDVSGSWKKFSDEFLLALALQELMMGSKFTNLRNRIRAVTWLKAMGFKGRAFYC